MNWLPCSWTVLTFLLSPNAPLELATVPTTLVRKTLPELSREAQAIVRGRVTSVTAEWNSERTLIWTTTVLAIEETVSGSAADRVSVREPGGVVGEVTQVVPSMARYREGEHVIVFLTRDALDQWRTLGCFQGRFVVESANQGSGRSSDRVAIPAALLPVVASVFGRAGPESPPTAAEFLTAVRRLAAARDAGR